MAHDNPDSPLGDDKLPGELNEQSNEMSHHEDGSATDGYDVERVEQVYRKLDLRIIPGMQVY